MSQTLFKTDRCTIEAYDNERFSSHQMMCLEYVAHHVPLRDGKHRRVCLARKSYPRVELIEQVLRTPGTAWDAEYLQNCFINIRGILWTPTGDWHDRRLVVAKEQGKLWLTDVGRELGWD